MVRLSHLLVQCKWGTVSVMRTQSFHYHRLCSRPRHDEDENDPGSLENLGNIENIENLENLENLENFENLDADVVDGTIINMFICTLSAEVKSN